MSVHHITGIGSSYPVTHTVAEELKQLSYIDFCNVISTEKFFIGFYYQRVPVFKLRLDPGTKAE